MIAIQLHDSRTRRRQTLEPLVTPGRPSLYVCGPTVYDRAHLGNARPVVVFDVLFRLLRHVYGADAVTYVRNFTDVDDKINARAAETGRPIRDITDETTRWYLEDMAALGALEPTHMPRATDHVGGMIALIERLIVRGHAYAAAGHVLFAVGSYPDYGRFSGRSLDDMLAGARVDVAPYKRDPMDFVLWKPSDPSLPGWDSPWGRGRPGWHIECSAMSFALLGPEFDIHGGGLDLMFPHHENEIAQSVCATEAGFARLWMHNEMLLVEGRKMSKSLGNFFTVRDLLDQGVPGEVIRYVMLMTHYRSPMDWTEAKRLEAEQSLSAFFVATDGVEPLASPPSEIVEVLSNDLNTPAAISVLHMLRVTGQTQELKSALSFLGFPTAEQVEWFRNRIVTLTVLNDAERAHQIWPYLKHWDALRRERRYQEADAYKKLLEATGLKLSATSGEPAAKVFPGFDPAKLPPLP